MTRRAWLLLGVLLVAQAALVWGVFLPSPHPGGDNAGYVSLAHSLVTGQGYTEIWDPAAPAHTKYPPVFPLLLSLAMALGASGWVALKTVPVLSALFAVAGVFLWARTRLSDDAAFGVALVTGLAPSLLYHSHWLLSDVPFLAFTALALWRLEKIAGSHPDGGATVDASSEDPPDAREAWVAALVATVLVALAYFTRSAGLPLVVSALGALAWRRRWRGFSLLAVGVGIPALLWFLRGRVAGPGEGRYGSEFFLLDPYQPDLGPAGLGDFGRRVWENLLGYGARFLPETFVGSAGPLATALVLFLLTLGALGWVRGIRRGPGTAELFVPLYAGLILLWPQVWAGDRFALPLVPPILLFAAEGVRSLEPRLGDRLRRVVLLGCGVLVAAPAARDWIRTRAEDAACRGALEVAGPWACGGPALVDFVAAARWAGEHLPEGSAALTRKPRIWYLMSGVPTRTYPFTEASGGLREAAAEAGADYVVLDFIGSQGTRFVGAALSSEPETFCQLAVFGGSPSLPATRILGIAPPGAPTGSIVAEGRIQLAACSGGQPEVVANTSAPGRDGWRIPLLEMNRSETIPAR